MCVYRDYQKLSYNYLSQLTLILASIHILFKETDSLHDTTYKLKVRLRTTTDQWCLASFIMDNFSSVQCLATSGISFLIFKAVGFLRPIIWRSELEINFFCG